MPIRVPAVSDDPSGSIKAVCPQQFPAGIGWDQIVEVLDVGKAIPFLAMAHYRLGQETIARSYLADAMTWIDQAEQDSAQRFTLPRAARWYHWQERAEVRALRREADALLGPIE